MRSPQALSTVREVKTHGRTRRLRITARDGLINVLVLAVYALQIQHVISRARQRSNASTRNCSRTQIVHDLREVAVASRLCELLMEAIIRLNGVVAIAKTQAERIQRGAHLLELLLASARCRA